MPRSLSFHAQRKRQIDAERDLGTTAHAYPHACKRSHMHAHVRAHRFRAARNGAVLLCTDVAARGLDVPGVEKIQTTANIIKYHMSSISI